ncbi:MAG TPA: cell division protein ZapA [Ruminococcaceae bacterium]|nr:cell division protein ZapA [Oscillospiraceae bacterium]
MEKNRVRLNICGADYAITTEDDPKYVLALGDELDAVLTKTLRENSRLSVTQAAILVALDYADQCKKAEVSADNLRSQIKEYLEDSAHSKMDAEIARREVERLTRELQNVQGKLG